MPCRPSIATCACEPLMSCRHIRLSKGIDAFISRMTAEGPSAKRPPHIALELCLRSTIALLLLAACLIGGCDRQSEPQQQANAADAAVSPASPMPDRLDRTHKGEAAPSFVFQDPKGAKVTIAKYRGKPVLLNLWATWCAPCVKEMPTLDTLPAREGDRLQV